MKFSFILMRSCLHFRTSDMIPEQMRYVTEEAKQQETFEIVLWTARYYELQNSVSCNVNMRLYNKV